MNSPTLSEINIFPIKSTAGISVSNAWVDDFGISDDRRFVLSDPNGQFITARKYPKLALIQGNLTTAGLILTAPNMDNLVIKLTDLTENYQNVTVWQDNIQGQLCLAKHHQWFSDYLATPCQLLFFGRQSKRVVKDKTNGVAFADGFPLLVISQASLNELNRRSARNNVMAQFRPNIVIENTTAFAEDTWHKIQIGDVIFDVSKPCARCIFTTIDLEKGQFDKSREPISTLATFRKGSDNQLYFGQNLIPLNQGQIKVGDKLTVLSTQTPEIYPDNTKHVCHKQEKSKGAIAQTTAVSTPINSDTIPDNSLPQGKKNVAKKVNISFDSWNIQHQGNTQDTLLEQGEEAGLIMHYSCRGGNCGRCKVKLQSGDVEQLTTEGLLPQEEDEGYILACSSIPKSDVVVSKA